MEESIESQIKEKIIHVMTIFPRISRSMLQVGIGTSISPGMWKPVFTKMMEDGVIVEEQVSFSTPAGRHQNYGVLRLASTTAPVMENANASPTTTTMEIVA